MHPFGTICYTRLKKLRQAAIFFFLHKKQSQKLGDVLFLSYFCNEIDIDKQT